METEKIKKSGQELSLSLTTTDDILAHVAKRRKQFTSLRVVVGFAAETQELLENARKKLQQKALTFIVANDVSRPDAGFGVDTNRVTILPAQGEHQSHPLQSKAGVARLVIDRVISELTEA